MADRERDTRLDGADQPPGAYSGSRDPRPEHRRVFRWSGVIPLVLLLTLLIILYLLFAERVARDSASEAASKYLGTEVDVGAVDLHETSPAVDIREIAIADPFDPMRNLIQADRISIELDADALLERKFVVRHLDIQNVRLGTQRERPARPAPRNGFAATAISAVREWKSQFDVPLLQLTPIDTIRSIALDPTQLATVQRALELRSSADSVRASLETGYDSLRLRETLDSARALSQRLSGASPIKLGIAGTRQAVADVRRTLGELRAAKERVEALEKRAESGRDLLTGQVRAVNDAREDDFRFASGLLHLPTVEAPDIGSAVFGDITIDRFQQAVYWSELAQSYLPPGLRPRRTPGPERARASGTTVQFVEARSYPTFLLRRGDMSLRVEGSSPASGDYSLAVANLTTEPQIVGRPMQFLLTRESGGGVGASGARLRAFGSMDHLGGAMRDSLSVSASGIGLPGFDLPGLPLRAELGRGGSALVFSRDGDQIRGAWQLRTSDVSWVPDSASASAARGNDLNQLEQIAIRVISGLTDLEMTARIGGTLSNPRLSVTSNLDQAVANRIKAVLGEEIAKAEARVRGEVERIFRARAAPVLAQVNEIQAQFEARVVDARTDLEARRAELEERLRGLGGLGGLGG
jgi:uncharacterized protein (TIGR03545 family)